MNLSYTETDSIVPPANTLPLYAAVSIPHPRRNQIRSFPQLNLGRLAIRWLIDLNYMRSCPANEVAVCALSSVCVARIVGNKNKSSLVCPARWLNWWGHPTPEGAEEL